MYNLVTIGDAVIDTHVFIDDASLECDYNHQNCQLCLTYASKIPIADSWQSLGGNAANVAVGAKKLGLKSAILTSAGDDSNGKIIKEELKKGKVNTKLLSLDKKTKTRYSVVLNFKGERTILSYHQKRDYRFPEKLPRTDWVYYTSLSDGYENLQTQLLSWLNQQKNTRLAYNPGSVQLKNLTAAKQAVARADILIVNLEEAEKLLNTSLNKELGGRALLTKLLQLGAKEAVITNGADGAWAGNANEFWQIASFPVTVVSKTGAGDAFSSGYLAARFYDHDLKTALKWGIANSCAVISTAGPNKNLLNVAETKKIIAQFSSIEPKPAN